MAGIYNIIWHNVSKNLTFWRWRRTVDESDSKLYLYIKSIMSSVQVLSDKLNTLDDDTLDFLKYNGQHKVLEEYLNDKYDEVQRQIYITENNIAQLDPVSMGLSGETVSSEVEIGLSGETVTVPVSMALSGEVLQDNNFTINIPVTVIFDTNVLAAQLSNYVLAGKEYNIVTF